MIDKWQKIKLISKTFVYKLDRTWDDEKIGGNRVILVLKCVMSFEKKEIKKIQGQSTKCRLKYTKSLKTTQFWRIFLFLQIYTAKNMNLRMHESSFLRKKTRSFEFSVPDSFSEDGTLKKKKLSAVYKVFCLPMNEWIFIFISKNNDEIFFDQFIWRLSNPIYLAWRCKFRIPLLSLSIPIVIQDFLVDSFYTYVHFYLELPLCSEL